MIRFKVLGLRFAQAWFDEPIEQPYPDIAILRHSLVRPSDGRVTVKHSLTSDLGLPEEELFGRIGKTCRYKIKRSESKDGATCTVEATPAAAEVEAFIAFYDRFAAQKGLAPINRKRFGAIAGEGRLWLSSAEVGGTVMVRHAHVVSGTTARMLYSASLFRDSDAEERAAIGRANRLLHWRDMLAFKAAGFRTYDWGGIFADETASDRKGINDFKREFGGEPVRYFESYRACSLMGRAALGLLSLGPLRAGAAAAD